MYYIACVSRLLTRQNSGAKIVRLVIGWLLSLLFSNTDAHLAITTSYFSKITLQSPIVPAGFKEW